MCLQRTACSNTGGGISTDMGGKTAGWSRGELEGKEKKRKTFTVSCTEWPTPLPDSEIS